jgi:hypothetical protein
MSLREIFVAIARGRNVGTFGAARTSGAAS